MMLLISLIVYNLLLPVVTLAMAPSALLKMQRRGGRWRDFAQRFGFWPAALSDALAQMKQRHGIIWMHAVSVGEVGVAKKLILSLLKAEEGLAVVLTSTTPTGLEQAQEMMKTHAGRVLAVYSPLDLPLVVDFLLQKIAPKQMVLVEAEVWPNLMAAAQRNNIPVKLVNARLSERSGRRFASVRALISPIFGMLDTVAVQEKEDAARWQHLGVRAERIIHTGSIKYDPQGAAPKAEQVEELACVLQGCGLGDRRPILLAASTHAGEERALAVVYLQLINDFPQLGFVVVPRHFERGASVVDELRDLGLRVGLRSQSGQQTDCDALVVDSTGELKAWQQLATVVVIGKSFLAEGGQNPAEAIMAGKPVICGPHMENFIPLMQLLLRAQGIMQVRGLDEVAPAVSHFLNESAQAATLAQRGREALQKHDGATAATVRLLLNQTSD
jgi:3-deoxy-D-manno-octulosonic-acid transferase